jgi:dihydroflavonol-4-reductase
MRQLLADGHSVSALVRPGRERLLPANPLVKVFAGDVNDYASIQRAADGVDGLFHVAAVYAYWHSDPSNTYRTNVDGTENVLRATVSAGVRRAVFTSTVATLKWPGHGKIADETSEAQLSDLPGHYKRSKLLAEQAALAFNGSDIEVVVVNPTAPFGPGDHRPTPTGRIVLEFLNRRFPGYLETGINVCDVDDVAAGHIGAFERGQPGQRYILGSENIGLRDIYRVLGEATGLRRRPIKVPYALAYSAGLADVLIKGKLLRREPFIPLEGLKVSRHPMYVDCTKAVIELGLPQRAAVDSLLRAAKWFVANGYSNARINNVDAPSRADGSGGGPCTN